MPTGGRPPGNGPPPALIAVVAGVVVLALVAAGFAVTALAGDDESASSDRTTTTRQQTTTTEGDEEDDEEGDGPAPAPSTTVAPTPAAPDAPSGGGGGSAPPATTGDVVVELGWSGGSDLDLSVVGPDGSEAARGGTSATGGTHGGDTQPGCGATGSQRETVTWFGAAPRGGYQVVVNGFDDCGAGPTSFDITVTVGGQVVDSHGGTVAVGQRATSSFTIG